MIIKLLMSAITTFGMFTGTFAVNNYLTTQELIINDEVVLKGNPQDVNKQLDNKVNETKEQIIENSRTLVNEIEKKYNKDFSASEVEEVKVTKNSKYNYDIKVTHSVKRTTNKEIAFTKETKKDDSKFNDYKEVTQKGKNGSETVIMDINYINGSYEDSANDIKLVDATNEVTTVGTKAKPQTNNSYNNGYSNNWNSSNGGYSGGSSNKGNSSSVNNGRKNIWYWSLANSQYDNTSYPTPYGSEYDCLMAVSDYRYANNINGSYACYNEYDIYKYGWTIG
ncbi:MAG: G5 domain-containing protein [Bacilli bacterium]